MHFIQIGDGSGCVEFCVPTDELLASAGATRSKGGKSSSNSQYNIKIATFKEVTTSYSTNDPEDPEGGSYGPNKVCTITTESINYYDMVKQYTMPFDYLWQLLVISEDRGFIFELLRTIYESDIEITVNDKLDDTTVITTNNYTVTETLNEKGTVLVRYEQETEKQGTNGNKDKTTTVKEEAIPAAITNKIVRDDTITTVKEVHTLTNTVKVDLTRANVWIVDYAKDYVYKEDSSESQSASSFDNEEMDKDLQPGDEQYLIDQAKAKAKGKVISTSMGGDFSGSRHYSKHDRVQNIETSTHTQGYEEGEKSLREKTQKILINTKKLKKERFRVEVGVISAFTDIQDVSEEDQLTDEDKEAIENGDTEGLEESETNTTEDTEQEEKDDKESEEKTEDKENEEETPEETEGNLETEIVDINTFKYKEKNFVTLLTTYKKGRTNILNAGSWLFQLIEENKAKSENKSTIDMLDLTKYLLYKVTGSELYGVTEFDFSLFEPGDFSDVDNPLTGDTPEEQVWCGLRKAGYSEEATAGAMGNIYCESGFRFDAIESNGEGHGLIQWSFGRKQNLFAKAASMGKEWKDPEVQIEFLLDELKEGGPMDCMGLNGCSRSSWVKSSTPEDAALQFEWWFEKHKGGTQPARSQKAREYYDQFKGRPLSSFGNANDGDMPTYYQNDYDNVRLGNVTIAIGGCGPTSMAMVVSAIKGEKITPIETSSFCEKNGYYVNNQGTAQAFFKAAADHYKVNCIQLGNDIDGAVKALKEGKYVISNQGPGLFTKHGHYIVLQSIDSSGKITVKDPYKPNAVDKGYKDRKFSISEISEAGKVYWVLY